MIERIIAALGSKSVGLELTSKEIADVLWLAVQMQRKSAPSSLQVQPIQPTLPETPVIPSQSNKNTDSQKPSTSKEKSTNIYPQSPASNSDDSTESSGLPIKVPSPQALRNQLALARSLKPLKRRVPSRTACVIDEGATAQRIAEEKLWIPVMRPAPERWLEVALVIDESPSMMLWKQTIKEFRQLLERHGAFRDVRTWELSINTNEKILLRPSGSAQKRFHSPKELIEPNGRRLFLVISDCVSPAWRSGAITRALSVWANTSPMAILQVLPEWLWERSALGMAESVLLRSLAPGLPNQQLIATAFDLLDDVTNSLKIPVVSLEPESLKAWALIVAGAGDAQSKGFLFASYSSILNDIFVQTESSGASLSAKQRLQRFRLSASPMARKLAGLMAAAPVSLPVVRLIQQTMLPQSSQVHVAEVFLGGILKPLSDINVDVETDNVQYDFFDGVRDLLLDSVPTNLSTEVVGNISDYVAKRAGLSVDEFTGILTNALLPTNISKNVLVRPFAKITAQVLRRLGGSYAQLAKKLEQFSESSSQADIYKVKQETPVFNYKYQIGGCLPGSAPTYIERQADKDLYKGLKAGEFCYVFNSRQMGKSSLRMRVMERLLQEGYACAVVDVTGLGSRDITEEQWYIAIIDTLIDEFILDFDLEYWWKEQELLSPNKRFSKFIETVLLVQILRNNPNKKIVIFIDEIDSIYHFINIDNFFAAILECYNRRIERPAYNYLTFTMLGVTTPSELTQDKQHTVFNIGRAIELNGFQINETEPLEKGLVSIGNPKKLMRAILHWTAGQPFLTQKICWLIVKSNVIPTTGNEAAWVAELVDSEIIKNWEYKDDPEHLRTIRDRILRFSGEESRRLLRLYQNIILQQGEIIADGSSECIQLRLSGLVVKKGETLKVCNPIYKAVFNENWVNKQQQQFNLKKILILSANPQSTSQLRLDEEVREIQTALKRVEKRSQFEIISQWVVRPTDLRRALLDHAPEIVHFSAHGRGNQGLILENNLGETQLINAESLAILFKLFNKIECVVFNGCYSEEQAQAISQYISYVVGIKNEISDQAIKFAVGFYDALGAGRSYEEAYEFGCIAIDLENIPEYLKPVLQSKKTILEHNCYKEISRPGSLIRILKSSNSGKTTLLNKILQYASQQDYQTVNLNFQDADIDVLDNLSRLLQWLCYNISQKLNLADNSSNYWESWGNRLGSMRTFKKYLDEYLLPQIPNALALGIDNLEGIFKYPRIRIDFFGLLRSCHEEAKRKIAWQKLRIIIVYSKDAGIPLSIDQSPFNVGLTIEIPSKDK